MKTTKRQIGVAVDEESYELLRWLAYKKHISMGKILLTALEEHFEKLKVEEKELLDEYQRSIASKLAQESSIY